MPPQIQLIPSWACLSQGCSTPATQLQLHAAGSSKVSKAVCWPPTCTSKVDEGSTAPKDLHDCRRSRTSASQGNTLTPANVSASSKTDSWGSPQGQSAAVLVCPWAWHCLQVPSAHAVGPAKAPTTTKPVPRCRYSGHARLLRGGVWSLSPAQAAEAVHRDACTRNGWHGGAA